MVSVNSRVGCLLGVRYKWQWRWLWGQLDSSTTGHVPVHVAPGHPQCCPLSRSYDEIHVYFCRILFPPSHLPQFIPRFSLGVSNNFTWPCSRLLSCYKIWHISNDLIWSLTYVTLENFLPSFLYYMILMYIRDCNYNFIWMFSLSSHAWPLYSDDVRVRVLFLFPFVSF